MITVRGAFRRNAPFRTLIVRIEARVSAPDDRVLSEIVDRQIEFMVNGGLERFPANTWIRRDECGILVRYTYTNIYNDWGLVLFRWKEELRYAFRQIVKRMKHE